MENENQSSSQIEKCRKCIFYYDDEKSLVCLKYRHKLSDQPCEHFLPDNSDYKTLYEILKDEMRDIIDKIDIHEKDKEKDKAEISFWKSQFQYLNKENKKLKDELNNSSGKENIVNMVKRLFWRLTEDSLHNKYYRANIYPFEFKYYPRGSVGRLYIYANDIMIYKSIMPMDKSEAFDYAQSILLSLVKETCGYGK